MSASESGKPVDDRYLKGIELFNEGRYFEAHDVWEEWWKATAGAERDFIQGLIQMTSAFHHFTTGNMRGARMLHDSAVALLAPFGEKHRGLDLAAVRRRFDDSFREIVAAPLETLRGRSLGGELVIPFTPARRFTLALEPAP